MGFDVLSYAIGLQAGKASGGGSSEKVLLAEQTIEGFDYASNYDAYLYNLIPSPFVLTAGETYFIKWDGTVYECVAQDLSAMMAGMVAVGNLSPFGLSGNNEPFIINYDVSSNGSIFLAFDTATSHTVKIYQKTSSSGGSSATYKTDTFKVTAGQMTIEHGGGAVPDLIIVALDAVPGNGEVFFSFGFSEAMLSKLGGGYINSVTMASGGSSVSASSNTGIEGSGSTYYARYGGVRNVTATTFEIGNSEYTPGGQLQSDSSYSWYAFYGLA